MRLEVVILAAGKGTRMVSDLPKVLHRLAGSPLLGHVLRSAHTLGADAVHVVYGHGGEQVPGSFAAEPVHWILQDPQQGTGHAVDQAMPAVHDDAVVLVLYGDVPLIRPATLAGLVEDAATGSLAVLTAVLDDGAGYGRIVRDSGGSILKVVERKDANAEELALREINTGFVAVPARLMKGWLRRLTNDNAQGEYYLTDIVGMAVADGITIADRTTTDLWEISGINSRGELAQLERIQQKQQAEALMAQGVTLRDPARFDLRGSVSAGRDVEIDVNVILEGEVTIGDRVSIGANVVIRNSTLGDGVAIKENCVIEDAVIGAGCTVGPFARIRPGTELAENVHVGNFVEIKKSSIGTASKVNHLSYIGDTAMGSGVNIGAGTITANYDGANKSVTRIGDNASVGSNSVLVAPVSVGKGSTLGAGTILRKDAPDGELTVSVGKQKTIEGWKRPVKK